MADRVPADWKPTKFAYRGGRIQPGPAATMAARSLVTVFEVSEFYDRILSTCSRGRLLDLGCGAAPLLEAYSVHVESYVLADWPLSLHPEMRPDVYLDIRSPLPFANGSFDTVLISDVLEHTPNPAGVTAEIARVLRPGGLLLGNTPFAYPLHEAPHDYYRFTRHGLEHLLRESGFEHEVIVELGGVPAVLADVSLKAISRSPALRSLARVCARVWSLLPGSIRGTGKSNLPLGYGFTAQRVSSE